MTWRTMAEQVQATATQGANLVVSSFSQLVRNIAGGAAGVGASIWNSGSTVVGINVNQIESMQQAVNNYVQKLSDHLNEINSSLNTDMAFKGEYAAAVTEYVTAVTQACQTVISQLKAFNEELTRVQEAYTAYDVKLSKNISSSSQEVSQAASAYSSEQA